MWVLHPRRTTEILNAFRYNRSPQTIRSHRSAEIQAIPVCQRWVTFRTVHSCRRHQHLRYFIGPLHDLRHAIWGVIHRSSIISPIICWRMIIHNCFSTIWMIIPVNYHHQRCYPWPRVVVESPLITIKPLVRKTKTKPSVLWPPRWSTAGIRSAKATVQRFEKTWPYERTNWSKSSVARIHIGSGCETKRIRRDSYPRIVWCHHENS